MPAKTERHTKALEFFKDWSNALLVTTVAATGWVVQYGGGLTHWMKAASIGSLALAVMFGIFTLALIPLVQEQRKPDQSIYDVQAKFRGWPYRCKLKQVCFWQHILFLAGIGLYAAGAVLALYGYEPGK